MGIIHYTSFLIASFIFILSPGMDTIFVLNKSIVQGKKAGIYSTLGICTGVLVHTTLAAFGLSIILAESAMAFSVVKYLGAAYLIYLGITKLISGKLSFEINGAAPVDSHKKTFLSATLTNALNPKVAIFFLAFFPQFINPLAIKESLPFIILGSTYAFMSLLWFLVLTLFAGTFSSRLKANPSYVLWLNKCSACLFILMGIKIAFTKK